MAKAQARGHADKRTANLEIKVKLRRKAIDVAGIDFKVML
jgi:hypothetical protein